MGIYTVEQSAIVFTILLFPSHPTRKENHTESSIITGQKDGEEVQKLLQNNPMWFKIIKINKMSISYGKESFAIQKINCI